jgi:hypothetical protein
MTTRFLHLALWVWGASLSISSWARISLRGSYAYSPSVRVQGGRQDYYDGAAFAGRLGWIHGLDEALLSFHQTRQTANYTDVDPPTSAVDRMLGLGYRRYLVNGRIVFLEGAAQYAFSNDFDNGYGFSLGGGVNFNLGSRISFGVTTLYTFLYYENFSRRFLTQSVDLSFIF